MSKKLKSQFCYWLYVSLWTFLTAPFFFYLCWRYRKYKHHNQYCAERLSLYKSRKHSTYPLWIHLASVGEVKASLPLLQRLTETHRLADIVFTTTTPTGEQILRQSFGESVSHFYLPFDTPYFMGRFIKMIKPRCLIVFETEVWPAMICQCHRLNIHCLLINARLSEKSLLSYRRFLSFSQHIFSKISLVLAQTKEDLQRFKSLGANNIDVTGSLKSDIEIKSQWIADAAANKDKWSNSGKRKIILAASVHPGEDKLVLDGYRRLQKNISDLLLIIVPRHADNFTRVEKLCIAGNFSVIRRSSDQAINQSTNILLGDTMGELLMLCGCADVVVMGGTFIDHGGHNFLEPAVWGVPVVSGQSVYNFEAIAKGLLNVGGLTQVADEEMLFQSILQLLKDDSLRQEGGAAAREFVENNRGVLDKLTDLMEPYINS